MAFRPDLTLLGVFRNGPRGELGLFRLLLRSRVSLSCADPFGCCTPLSPSVSQREAWMAFCSFCNGGMRTAGKVGALGCGCEALVLSPVLGLTCSRHSAYAHGAVRLLSTGNGEQEEIDCTCL